MAVAHHRDFRPASAWATDGAAIRSPGPVISTNSDSPGRTRDNSRSADQDIGSRPDATRVSARPIVAKRCGPRHAPLSGRCLRRRDTSGTTPALDLRSTGSELQSVTAPVFPRPWREHSLWSRQRSRNQQYESDRRAGVHTKNCAAEEESNAPTLTTNRSAVSHAAKTHNYRLAPGSAVLYAVVQRSM